MPKREEAGQNRTSWRLFCLTSFPSEQEIGCKGLDFLREAKGIIHHTCCMGSCQGLTLKLDSTQT